MEAPSERRGGGETERERETHTHIHREREREIDRQTDRQTETERLRDIFKYTYVTCARTRVFNFLPVVLELGMSLLVELD